MDSHILHLHSISELQWAPSHACVITFSPSALPHALVPERVNAAAPPVPGKDAGAMLDEAPAHTGAYTIKIVNKSFTRCRFTAVEL